MALIISLYPSHDTKSIFLIYHLIYHLITYCYVNFAKNCSWSVIEKELLEKHGTTFPCFLASVFVICPLSLSLCFCLPLILQKAE